MIKSLNGQSHRHSLTLSLFSAKTLPLLLILISISYPVNSAGPLSCRIAVLKDLGWETQKARSKPGIENTDTCNSDLPPVFTLNRNYETSSDTEQRAHAALHSITTRCLVSRQYKKSIEKSVGRLISNTGFKFPPPGKDPRDPFTPPPQSWTASTTRGYDIPLYSIGHAVNALYTHPFIAECSAAAQLAQLSILKEHYSAFTDVILNPLEVGIGIWPQYIKNPSIKGESALLIDSKKRKHALKELATLGKGAFYGQSGYIKPYQNLDYIDSLDNRGQNFVITNISDTGVEALKKRRRPLKELSKISKTVWKRYKKKLDQGGDKKQLVKEMEQELSSIDPFFREVEIYVHPLKIKSFAYHLARQFKWNPRTPFVIHMYEDFQSGYFHNRYIDYRIRQCEQQSYCRQVDKNAFVSTDNTGTPGTLIYKSMRNCERALLNGSLEQ